jgi:hypothetical protein
MGYAEMFNEAFDIYKRNFGLFAGIGAVVYLPFALLSALTVNLHWPQGLLALLLFLPMRLVEGAIVKALADRYLGREATIAGSWRYVLRRGLAYLATSLRVARNIFLGSILFIVPGILMAFFYFFVPQVMIVEERYRREATQRSRELAAGQWGRIFVVGVLTLVLSGGALALAGALKHGLASVFPFLVGSADGLSVPLPAALTKEFLDAGAKILVLPFTWLLGVLLYFDVRIRKEGFDIELLAQEMDADPMGAEPATAPV